MVLAAAAEVLVAARDGDSVYHRKRSMDVQHVMSGRITHGQFPRLMPLPLHQSLMLSCHLRPTLVLRHILSSCGVSNGNTNLDTRRVEQMAFPSRGMRVVVVCVHVVFVRSCSASVVNVVGWRGNNWLKDVEVSRRDEYEKGTTIERACRKRWWSFSLLS